VIPLTHRKSSGAVSRPEPREPRPLLFVERPITKPEDVTATQLVVGLCPSRGIVLDAFHRPRTKGIPASRHAYRVLKQIGRPPPI